jgi:hypothetical protein
MLGALNQECSRDGKKVVRDIGYGCEEVELEETIINDPANKT